MKLIKSFSFGISIFLILNLIATILSYFNIINSNVLKIIIFIITILISGIYLGLNYKKKGLINGIKLSLIYILLSSVLILILPNLEFSLKIILYYLLIITLSIIGSIIGVNLKKTIK